MKQFTVDEFVTPLFDEKTGLPIRPIVIIDSYGSLIFDSTLPEDDPCGIIELPVLKSKVVETYENGYGDSIIIVI